MDFERLLEIKKEAASELQAIGKSVLERRKPPAGVYAFFTHNAHALEGLEDIQRILTRLFEGRAELTRLAHEEDAIKPRGAELQGPLPEELQTLLRQEHELNGYMKMDLEALYIFGAVLLDQWALLTLYLGGLINRPRRERPFLNLVRILDADDSTPLDPLRPAIRVTARWLYWQLRFYRNHFIIHANRPWQRGTTRSLYGNDFNLHTPTPHGWLSETEEAAINEEVRSYLHLGPKHIQDAPDDYWQKKSPRALLEVLFNRIGEIEQSNERERIGFMFGQVGGSTPTFQVVASNLLVLVRDGTRTLNAVVTELEPHIDLGPPASLHPEEEDS